MWWLHDRCKKRLAAELAAAYEATASQLNAEITRGIAAESKQRELTEQFATELAETRGELNAEMHRRIAAEALAEDRAQQIEKAYELLAQANESRDAAISERLKSLDLVNTTLLNQLGPEKPPPDIKQFTPREAIPKKMHGSEASRIADEYFKKFVLDKLRDKKSPAPTATPTQVQ